MKRIKLALGWLLLLVVVVSMGVTNFVILPFWAGDIVTRESRSLQRFLAAASFAGKEDAPRLPPPAVQSFIQENPAGCIYYQGEFHPPGLSCQQGLQPYLAAAERSGTMQTSRITLLDLLGKEYLYVALPDTRAGLVAAGIPLAQTLHSLWTKEQIILVYLALNAAIIAAFAFFRLLRAYVFPVDRMARAVEKYQSDGFHALLAEQPANELGQLSRSIKAMVQRIETDKEKLTETVEELAAKNALLQENQRGMIRTEKLASVGRLAAGFAHEIGNPLGVAQGYLQLLAMGHGAEQERGEYIGKTLRELDRMDGLIRRLLDCARPGQGMPVVSDAHAALAGIVEDLAAQPFLKGINLAFIPQARRCDVFVDCEQLRQVILNCVLNAADAIHAVAGRQSPGTISIATTHGIAASGEAPMLHITIADNGAGIPEDLLETVFDPFFTTKEPGNGTGLGLSVSLALVESMNGRMELQSRAGAGTTVHIILPLAGEDAAAEDGSIPEMAEFAE